MKRFTKIAMTTTQVALLLVFSSITSFSAGAAGSECPLTISTGTLIGVDKEIVEEKGYIYLAPSDGDRADVRAEVSTDIRVGGPFDLFTFERGSVSVSVGNELIAFGKTVRRTNLSQSPDYSAERYQQIKALEMIPNCEQLVNMINDEDRDEPNKL